MNVFGRFVIEDGRNNHRKLTALSRKVVFEKGRSLRIPLRNWRFCAPVSVPSHKNAPLPFDLSVAIIQ